VRIVSLLPSATEIRFAIGAGDGVVGVTHECDFPPPALLLPKVTSSAARVMQSSAEIDRHVRAAVHAGSSLYHLDRALLESLAPDVIVTQELCPVCAVSYDLLERAAKQSRLPREPQIVSLEPSSLEDVFANIVLVGRVTGHAHDAEAVVAALRLRIAALAAHSRRSIEEAGAKPRILFLEWTEPPMSAGHWIPELVEFAGGAPLLANPGRDSQRLSWDAIAAADPDAIVVAPCGFDLDRTRAGVAELQRLPQWLALRAVRGGNVLAADGNAYFSRPGPRLVDSAEILGRWFRAWTPRQKAAP
jgi:iron complex transport system substrate-binding protein